MTSDRKTLEIGFEQDMPASAAAKEKYVIPVPAISRRTFFAGGTAVGASLLLSQMARPESLAGVDGPPLKEYDIAYTWRRQMKAIASADHERRYSAWFVRYCQESTALG